MKKVQEIEKRESEIVDRLIKCNGEIKVKHIKLGVCVLEKISIGKNRSVVRDYKGDHYSVYTSDLTLID